MAKNQLFTVRDFCDVLEAFAPLSLQEDYDNAGLIVGSKNANVSNVLLSLDCTEEVIDEAISKKCGLIISHHPIIFRGLKKINNDHYVERVITKAIKNDIALYASHTNIDNSLLGVNRKIAEVLGLEQTTILAPKNNQLLKLFTYVPKSHLKKVENALFDAGAGRIGKYSECSFHAEGIGTFKPSSESNPFSGDKGQQNREPEIKIELILPFHLKSEVLRSLFLAHPYEEVAYEFIQLQNSQNEIGSGIIGELPKSLNLTALLRHIQAKMKAKGIRYTSSYGKKFKKIAICGGSGSFLINKAIRAKADAIITADVKYHEFFEADNQISIIDIGHYESEQHTPRLFYDILSKKFPTFALHLSKINTNPIKYF